MLCKWPNLHPWSKLLFSFFPELGTIACSHPSNIFQVDTSRQGKVRRKVSGGTCEMLRGGLQDFPSPSTSRRAPKKIKEKPAPRSVPSLLVETRYTWEPQTVSVPSIGRPDQSTVSTRSAPCNDRIPSVISLVELKMQTRFLPHCSDTLLVQRSGNVWMKRLKYNLALDTIDPNSLLHECVVKRKRHHEKQQSRDQIPLSLAVQPPISWRTCS